MANLLLIRDSLPNKISYYLIMLLLAALPFDQFYSHAVFACFAVHTLIHLKKDKVNQLLSVGSLLLTAIFFITLIGVTYTHYRNDAIIDITRQSVILLFPLFFALTTLNLNKYRDNFLQFFTIVCTGTVAYLYIQAFVVIQFYHLPVKAIFAGGFINHNFSAPIQMHATFFSLQVAVAFFYAMVQMVTKQPRLKKVLCALTALLLFGGLVQLGSKAVMAAVLIGMNVFIPYFLIAKGNRLKYAFIAGTISILLIGCALNEDSFRARYLTDLKIDLSKAQVDEVNDARLPRWTAAMQVIVNSPIIGYGTGSELNVLGDKFYQHKLYNAYLHRLNAHNQYLSFLITSGVIGLMVYLTTLFWGFKIALMQRDIIFYFFLVLVTTVSFSESLLNAEKGVFFYSLFFSFFIFSGQYQSVPIWSARHKKLFVGATKGNIATSSL